MSLYRKGKSPQMDKIHHMKKLKSTKEQVS